MTNRLAHFHTGGTDVARPQGPRRSEVGPVELFFDLVYVFAIIQLSHMLIDDLTWLGFVHTAVVFAAVWWGWNYTAWAMNWLNPENTFVQLLNGVLMLLALGMAVGIPDAFGDSGLLFAGCFVAMGVLRPVVMVVAFHGQRLADNYRVLGIWSAAAGVFWVTGALLPADARLMVWLLALVIDYAAPRLEFRVPGVGSAPMEKWDTDAEHLAERNRLVFIIALGESILLMGGALVALGAVDGDTLLSLFLGFTGLFVLWWNYFALAGHDVQGGEGGTAALRSAYAYAHALMVGGAILVAVSIELRLSHPDLTTETVLVTIGGPLVYLIGNVLFLRSRFGRIAVSRFIAAGLLVAVGTVGLVATAQAEHVSALALTIPVLIIMLGLALDTARTRRFSAADPAQHSAQTPDASQESSHTTSGEQHPR